MLASSAFEQLYETHPLSASPAREIWLQAFAAGWDIAETSKTRPGEASQAERGATAALGDERREEPARYRWFNDPRHGEMTEDEDDDSAEVTYRRLSSEQRTILEWIEDQGATHDEACASLDDLLRRFPPPALAEEAPHGRFSTVTAAEREAIGRAAHVVGWPDRATLEALFERTRLVSHDGNE